MKSTMKSGFTLLELVFVLVIIGILAAIGGPKLMSTRTDAVIVKGRSTVASVRSAIATERQRRIVAGSFTAITDLAKENGKGKKIFDIFDGNANSPILEYPPRSCAKDKTRGCWISTADTTYTFRMPDDELDVDFTLGSNRLTCDPDDATTGADCRLLSE